YNLIDIKNKDGYGLLSYAALHQRPDIVRFMIRRGANLNETNTLKETPLMIAVKNNNLEIVYMLARSGCDVNQKDRFGHSSIDKAKTNNSSQIHEYLSSITNK
nr:ankyrin repeat domain-containing protein [Alphaproteobacteria bacterium]